MARNAATKTHRHASTCTATFLARKPAGRGCHTLQNPSARPLRSASTTLLDWWGPRDPSVSRWSPTVECRSPGAAEFLLIFLRPWYSCGRGLNELLSHAQM